MEQPAQHLMTVAEFVHWDDGTETRYELENGRPVAMNPPSARHVVMAMNLARTLDARLPPRCRSFVAGGLARSNDDDEYRIPDVLVTCAPPGRYYFEQPRLAAEILSPSTEREDRTAKLDFYKSLPSVEVVLLVWQEVRRVELHSRRGEVWEVRTIIGGEVPLAAFGAAIPVEELYADI